MNKKNKIIIISIAVIFVVGLLIFYLIPKKSTSSNDGSKTTTSNIDTNVNTDDGDEDIDWSKYETKEIKLNNSLNITESGIYNISGTITDGLITIDTDDNVKLILNDVSITNSNGPAIYIKGSEDVVIELNGKNTLEDGKEYSNSYEDVDGTLFSHDDLTIEGSGSLIISANYMDGIVSKDDLKITSGTYIINSNDDGIRGKDSVYILDGKYEITSLGDGIKSTEDTDTEKGFIKISGGEFDIDATLDGIQAETKLVIDNGKFTIKTGDGSSNSSSTNDDWGMWRDRYNPNESNDTGESAKGLKAGNNLVINNGTFTLNTSDDSIHSNNYTGISNGTINITSGDDGIHADKELIIDNGTIKITKSYEGLESSKMTINGGNINLVASDDGINIAGGNDGSAMNRPGENNYSNTDNILTINGGTIYVDATGDGIDVNGKAYINGGTITVDGPTNSGNGALDYDSIFDINGGTFIAAGASGMAQGPTNSSKQYNVMINFTSSYSSSDKITIVDSSDKEIMNYTSNKSFSSLVYSSNKLESNKKYTIKVNGTEYDTFETSNTCITVGASNGMHGGGVQQPGGMRPGRR